MSIEHIYVFFVHSSTMAEQEFSVVSETEDNPLHQEPSNSEDPVEGKQLDSSNLVQAIVADQSLVTTLSSTILSDILPQLKSSINEFISALSSQNQAVNSEVSDD